MRALAVDFGTVRIGLAVSDELGVLTTPLTAYKRTQSIKRDAAAIARHAGELLAVEIVVGLPLTEDGQVGPSARAAEEFAARLGRYTRIPIIVWDERLSSFEAELRLRDAGVSPRRIRDLLDSQAAAVILESYLNHVKNKPPTDDAA